MVRHQSRTKYSSLILIFHISNDKHAHSYMRGWKNITISHCHHFGNFACATICLLVIPLQSHSLFSKHLHCYFQSIRGLWTFLPYSIS